MKTDLARLPWLGGMILVAWALAAQSPSPASRINPVSIGSSSNRATVHVLYPAPTSIVTTNGLLAVALTSAANEEPSFVLDGQPLETKKLRFDRMWMGRTTRFSPATTSTNNVTNTPSPVPIGQLPDKILWLASAPLTTGEHDLRIGDKRLRVFQSTSTNRAGPLANIPLMVWHPPASYPAELMNCRQCHDAGLPQGERTLGMVRVPQACYPCHDEGELPAIHRHVIDPLSRCQICHDPHGSTQPKLLIDTREKLCVQCHAAGHSKS